LPISESDSFRRHVRAKAAIALQQHLPELTAREMLARFTAGRLRTASSARIRASTGTSAAEAIVAVAARYVGSPDPSEERGEFRDGGSPTPGTGAVLGRANDEALIAVARPSVASVVSSAATCFASNESDARDVPEARLRVDERDAEDPEQVVDVDPGFGTG
jgi:hypothetical protein